MDYRDIKVWLLMDNDSYCYDMPRIVSLGDDVTKQYKEDFDCYANITLKQNIIIFIMLLVIMLLAIYLVLH